LVGSFYFIFNLSLGSFHDGDGFGEALAGNCNASENYIMTPGIGLYQTNLLNQFKFSSCSVAQFKKTLLTSDLRYNCCLLV
jgi:hypothetical protein